MLIDPGADINHILEDFCKRARVRTKLAPYTVQLVNKCMENKSVIRDKLTLIIESYSQYFRMASNPLSYDVILGEKWCKKHKARVILQEQYS